MNPEDQQNKNFEANPSQPPVPQQHTQPNTQSTPVDSAGDTYQTPSQPVITQPSQLLSPLNDSPAPTPKKKGLVVIILVVVGLLTVVAIAVRLLFGGSGGFTLDTYTTTSEDSKVNLFTAYPKKSVNYSILSAGSLAVPQLNKVICAEPENLTKSNQCASFYNFHVIANISNSLSEAELKQFDEITSDNLDQFKSSLEASELTKISSEGTSTLSVPEKGYPSIDYWDSDPADDNFKVKDIVFNGLEFEDKDIIPPYDIRKTGPQLGLKFKAQLRVVRIHDRVITVIVAATENSWLQNEKSIQDIFNKLSISLRR